MRIKTILMVFIMSISLSSCFDIIEEVTVNHDGTGSMVMTVNLSQSKTKLASIILMDSVNGHKIPHREDITKAIDDAVIFLKEKEGLTNVKKRIDFDNYIFSISCDFKSIENINSLTDELNGRIKIKPIQNKFSYNSSERKFNREHTYNAKAKEEFDKLNKKDQDIFNEATYTSIYRFEDDIVSASNKQSKISKSKKALMQKIPAKELIYGQTDLNNTIILK